MGETTVQRIQASGQSVWIDNIRRSMLTTGALRALVQEGISGLTSNPTIFEKALSEDGEYDSPLAELAAEGVETEAAFERLAAEDIQGAADVLRGVHDATGGRDGYVSLELPPPLADDSAATVLEAQRLARAIGRPNVMIKVPATPAGVEAFRQLTAAGVNVNVTLIFALDTYRAVAEAYLAGLEERARAGTDLGGVASVASFFVSRVDTPVDGALRQRIGAGEVALASLVGTAATANARAAYGIFGEVFGGPRFAALANRGARVQRPLWASTSTKDPSLPDTFYVDGLIGKDTVNTVPPATLTALQDHGQDGVTLTPQTVAEGWRQLEALARAGVDMEAVTARLLEEGLAAFAASYRSVLESIEARRATLGRA
ncbi:MAG: transaldolase [Chloroflexota bacterium]